MFVVDLIGIDISLISFSTLHWNISEIKVTKQT